jgi:hypothetical protein
VASCFRKWLMASLFPTTEAMGPRVREDDIESAATPPQNPPFGNLPLTMISVC